MRMTTPAACDESLFRVRYGPGGAVTGDGSVASASDADAQSMSKQEL